MSQMRAEMVSGVPDSDAVEHLAFANVSSTIWYSEDKDGDMSVFEDGGFWSGLDAASNPASNTPLFVGVVAVVGV